NPDAAYAVAVSLRETVVTPRPALAVALSDLTGTTRARAELAVDLDGGSLAETIRAAIVGQCADAGVPVHRVRQVQLAVPGAYNPRTDRIHHVHVPGLNRPGLVADLRHALGVPVLVDNDVNLAAVAERRRGVAAQASPAMLAELAARIAVGLAVVIAVLDPALVVLAGEVGQAGGPALRDAVAAATGTVGSPGTRIAVTGIADDAVLLGALDA